MNDLTYFWSSLCQSFSVLQPSKYDNQKEKFLQAASQGIEWQNRQFSCELVTYGIQEYLDLQDYLRRIRVKHLDP